MALSEEFHFQSPNLVSASLTAAVVRGDREFSKDTL